MLGDSVVGVIGAFLGGWIFATFLGVGRGGVLMSLVTAFIWATVLFWLIRLVVIWVLQAVGLLGSLQDIRIR